MAVVAGPEADSERGVYGISVAAELVGTGVQNLRLYEARGLLEPDRTEGGTRRYSANDLDRLRHISDLLDAGLNLAGISMVLDLEAQNTTLQAERQEHRAASTRPSKPAKRAPAPTKPDSPG
jgi:MerR family transcriptional regulator/heat shock protein HspR